MARERTDRWRLTSVSAQQAPRRRWRKSVGPRFVGRLNGKDCVEKKRLSRSRSDTANDPKTENCGGTLLSLRRAWADRSAEVPTRAPSEGGRHTPRNAGPASRLQELQRFQRLQHRLHMAFPSPPSAQLATPCLPGMSVLSHPRGWPVTTRHRQKL